MKKKQLLFALGALSMLLCATACSTGSGSSTTTKSESKSSEKDDDTSSKEDTEDKDKEDEDDKDKKKEADSGDDKEDKNKSSKDSQDLSMAVPGYAVGEVPPVPIPEVPDLSVMENPEAKITLNDTKKLSSVPGITITPVKVENGTIVSGNTSVQLDENGGGQYTDGNKTVQTDGDGTGQYVTDDITIQKNADGSGQYIDNKREITLQVHSDGSGQYSDGIKDVVFQIDSDGSGQYVDSANEVRVVVMSNDYTSYTAPDIRILHRTDGSGYYENEKLDLKVKNDGKGSSVVEHGSKTITVDAKPLGKPGVFSKLKPVPAIPAIEANSVLITLDSGVLFDVDKYNIRPDAYEVLTNLADILKEADIKKFQIDGHTDSDASDEHNQVLSENRAASVKNFLAEHGVTAEISTKGYGESRPVATNETAEGKQKNRRVEIIIPAF